MRKLDIKSLSTGSSLDDDALQTIEATFKQFNTFLDLLNEKGYVPHIYT